MIIRYQNRQHIVILIYMQINWFILNAFKKKKNNYCIVASEVRIKPSRQKIWKQDLDRGENLE